MDMHRVWVGRWVRMRAGVARIEIEPGRYRRVWRGDRVCKWCKRGEVEDLVHVVAECGRWGRERREMWDRVMQDDEKWGRAERGKGAEERVQCLLQGRGKKVRRGVLQGMTKLMCRRETEGGRGWERKIGEGRVHTL